jgi:hypothetical protein
MFMFKVDTAGHYWHVQRHAYNRCVEAFGIDLEEIDLIHPRFSQYRGERAARHSDSLDLFSPLSVTLEVLAVEGRDLKRHVYFCIRYASAPDPVEVGLAVLLPNCGLNQSHVGLACIRLPQACKSDGIWLNQNSSRGDARDVAAKRIAGDSVTSSDLDDGHPLVAHAVESQDEF